MFGTFLAILGFCMALYALIELKAMQKSTHQIQYVPVEDDGVVTPLTKEQKQDPFTRDFDNII